MEASVSIWVWAGIIAFCCRVRVSLVAFSHIEPDGKCGREGAHMGTERLRSANETRAVRTAGARVSVFGILTTLFGLLLCASLSGCSSESGKLDITLMLMDGRAGRFLFPSTEKATRVILFQKRFR